jgi:hypothetical protein
MPINSLLMWSGLPHFSGQAVTRVHPVLFMYHWHAMKKKSMWNEEHVSIIWKYSKTQWISRWTLYSHREFKLVVPKWDRNQNQNYTNQTLDSPYWSVHLNLIIGIHRKLKGDPKKGDYRSPAKLRNLRWYELELKKQKEYTFSELHIYKRQTKILKQTFCCSNRYMCLFSSEVQVWKIQDGD